MCEDVGKLTKSVLMDLLPEYVDGVIGGPPCQAFSEIGRADPNDPRRSLVGAFFNVVQAIRPTFFLMENVPGLMKPGNKIELDKALATLGDDWHVLGPVILDASDYGAPTKRKRVFVYGFRKDKVDNVELDQLLRPKQGTLKPTVSDAIADLSGAKELSGNASIWQYSENNSISEYAGLLRSKSANFTGHQKTNHKPETITRYSTVSPGAIDPVGKHKRLEWKGLCPTLRAGTGSDRGSYQAVRPLHPTEHRVITPREAARLQGFPDDFIFHKTVWHSFRMIGNSVSPIIAEVLCSNIMEVLQENSKINRDGHVEASSSFKHSQSLVL